MSSLTLDFTNCLASSIGATHGLTDGEIDTLVAKFPKHHESMEEIRNTKESLFFDLPYEDPTPIKDLAKKYTKGFENLVVIGIGGAAEGPRALLGSLLPASWNLLSAKDRRNNPRGFVVSNADPASINDLLGALDLKKTCFQVISRSGATVETMAVTLWLIDLLKTKVGKTAPAKHLVISTNPDSSPLVTVAEADKIPVIDIPANIADRFNTFGPASLFSAALCGIDIDALLAGAQAMDKRCRMDRAMQNPAYMHSLVHYLLTRKRRKTIHAMVAFADRLEIISHWYDHLLAVSLGKMLNKKGKAVHVGPGPASCVGPSACYGQLQLYLEGPYDKVTTFLVTKDHHADITAPVVTKAGEQLDFLSKASLATIIDQAYVGVAQTITASGRPNLTVILDDISPHSIGGLLFMLQLSTVMSAELYGIDPFDQPGIDSNKQAVYAQMGRSGFEDRATALAEYRNRSLRTC